jgi:UDP-N-acetylmuramate dehydrogenase
VILQEHFPLAPLTTFRVGGPARYFAEAQDEDDVVMALAFAKTRDLPVFVLGGGSNLLVSDFGFPGMVLRVAVKGVRLEPAGDNILLTAAAGEDWDPIVASCVETNLGGVECLSGIPGYVGKIVISRDRWGVYSDSGTGCSVSDNQSYDELSVSSGRVRVIFREWDS